jgi:hypothetical protein
MPQYLLVAKCAIATMLEDRNESFNATANSSNSMTLWQLDRVLELDFGTADHEFVELRIEVFHLTEPTSKKKFRFRTFRYEAFHVNPAFEVDPEFQRVIHIWPVLRPSEHKSTPEFESTEDAIKWYLAILTERIGIAIGN